MTYAVLLSSRAERFYRKLGKETQARVREALVSLMDRPHEGKRLHGDLRGNYSLRVEKLRIIYSISERDKAVCVTAIGPRKRIYR